MEEAMCKTNEKFLQLKEMVEKNGSEKAKELVSAAEFYIEGLNKIFNDRDVMEEAISLDFSMFLKELQEAGKLRDKKNWNMKLFIMDVLYVVRHTWCLVDKAGNVKTGNDLHRVCPLFEEEQEETVERVFEIIQNC